METKDINGWLNIDKPLEYSSAKVVAIVKRLLKVKKVGHGGTLDPLATGVLPICINKATKTTEKMMNFDKEYLFNITFGEERSTGDAEGEIIAQNSKIPTEEEIKNNLSKFIGNIEQMPPIYSALKVNGKRAYELARNNQSVELKPRNVIVHSFNFIGFTSNNTAQFSIKCGKGFYVRSIGIDFSKLLNTVGYISYLRRIAVGTFNQENIITIEQLKNSIELCGIEKNLLHI